MGNTPFARLAQLGEQLERTTKRLELTALVAGLLSELAEDEVAPAVRLVVGQVFAEWDGRALNLSWRSVMDVLNQLTDAPAELRDRLSAKAVDGGEYVGLLFEQAIRQPASPPPLTILEVYSGLIQIAETSGAGSRGRKEMLLKGLMRRTTAVEAKFLAKIIYQEMRHGVNEGIMLDAIARAAGARPAVVRQANQYLGDLGELARLALTQRESGLQQASVRLFHPVKPMLAETADQMEEAFERFHGRLALEYKLDGARVQIHRQGEQVHIYSRSLEDVTPGLPDVVAQVKSRLRSEQAILDGEAIAVDAQGRPLPFQHLMRRFRRKHDLSATVEEVPVQLHLFDVLLAEGESVVHRPAQERWQILEGVTGGLDLVRRMIPRTLAEAKAFADQARSDGHEGVMAKDLEASYSPGKRGKSWLKLKHVISLDLAIIAADWGYGRRHGWLSNYHLAARDEHSGEFALVGKTFKGLADDEFQAMTSRLLSLEIGRSPGTVIVRPQIVVEVLFNEIQASPHYPSGLALRFARIFRIRDDKDVSETDTLQTLRALFERQFEHKGRYEP